MAGDLPVPLARVNKKAEPMWARRETCVSEYKRPCLLYGTGARS